MERKTQGRLTKRGGCECFICGFLCFDSHGPRDAGGPRPTGRYIDTLITIIHKPHTKSPLLAPFSIRSSAFTYATLHSHTAQSCILRLSRRCWKRPILCWKRWKVVHADILTIEVAALLERGLLPEDDQVLCKRDGAHIAVQVRQRRPPVREFPVDRMRNCLHVRDKRALAFHRVAVDMGPGSPVARLHILDDYSMMYKPPLTTVGQSVSNVMRW